MPCGPRPDLVGHRRGQRTERAAGRALGVRLAGLKDAGRVVEARRAAARRCEARAIEEVVALRPEFEVLAFHHHELLGHGEIELADARTAQGIAAQVAERAGLRNRESRRIDIKRAVAHVVGVDSWNYVGSAYVAAVAAAGDVDHRSRHDHAVGNYRGRTDRARRVVAVDDVRPDDFDYGIRVLDELSDRIRLGSGEIIRGI